MEITDEMLIIGGEVFADLAKQRPEEGDTMWDQESARQIFEAMLSRLEETF